MATSEEKQKVRELAQQGKSVNQIKDQLELPKSTVYYHFKKEVGQKQKTNQPEIPDDPEFKGELCGIFAGDGNYQKDNDYHHQVRFFFNLNDRYYEILTDYLENKLNKRPNIYTIEDKTRATLKYNSKKLYKLLKHNLDWEENKSLSIRLVKEKNFSEEFKIGFLRGLIDTDGYINPNQRELRFNSISEKLMTDVSGILSELNINHNKYSTEDKRENCKDMHRVAAYSSSAEKLIRKIEPRHPKKQLADRWSNIGN